MKEKRIMEKGTVCAAPRSAGADGNATTTNRVVNVGGNRTNASNAGLFYFNGNTATNTNATIGGRLLVTHIHGTDFSSPQGENRQHRTGFSRFILERPRGQTRRHTMPKRVGFLYERMMDPEFIRSCIRKGGKGKRYRRDVRRALDNIDDTIVAMQKIVADHSFAPVEPNHKMRYDPSSQKYRETTSVPFFPDGIMHQMVVEAMKDVLMRGMSHWSCSSVPGRGGQRARRRVRQIVQRDPKGTRYAMELDIKQYYPSIPLEKLLDRLERKIKDEKFLLLTMLVVTCHKESLAHLLEDGVTARDLAKGKVGIGIGFYTNQWLANFFLEGADHLLEKHPGVKYEVRYMDNFSVFGPNKRKLHRARAALEQYLLEALGVKLKQNWQIFPVDKRLFSVVGYRIGRRCVILRKRNFLRLARSCRRMLRRQKIGLPPTHRQAAGLVSRVGQLKHCASGTIWEKYVKPIDMRIVKEVIRNGSKRQQSSHAGVHPGGYAKTPRMASCTVL